MHIKFRHFLEGDAGDNATSGASSSSASTTLLSGQSAPAATTSNGVTQAAPSWVNADGSFSEGWLDRLPEGLRGDATLRTVPNLEEMAKSLVATKRLVGTKLEMPGQDATPEQLASWRKTVGAPETPEGYLGEQKTIRPDAIPAELWDAASEKEFLSVAHKHSLPPAAVKDIMELYGSQLAKGLQDSVAQQEAVLSQEGAKLKQEWGGQHDANLAMAARVAKTVGLDPKTHPLFTSADAVKAFAQMGKLLSEDKLVPGETGSIGGSIQKRIDSITDPRSQDSIAREYRGDYGPERQAAAQSTLHQLYASRDATK